MSANDVHKALFLWKSYITLSLASYVDKTRAELTLKLEDKTMKKIVITNLKADNASSFFRELSPTETLTVCGGSAGSLNNYYINTNHGDINSPSNTIEGVGNSIRDSKFNTIDYSRSTYIVINSW
ncbi:hypothetical protein [Richelia sinica]|uniref:hypothetical protein n=2 Tax=Richelia sinica TaxID=1357545 RepID=UPI0016872CCE|nr:hypothetical protein [Richelia sinica]